MNSQKHCTFQSIVAESEHTNAHRHTQQVYKQTNSCQAPTSRHRSGPLLGDDRFKKTAYCTRLIYPQSMMTTAGMLLSPTSLAQYVPSLPSTVTVAPAKQKTTRFRATAFMHEKCNYLEHQDLRWTWLCPQPY